MYTFLDCLEDHPAPAGTTCPFRCLFLLCPVPAAFEFRGTQTHRDGGGAEVCQLIGVEPSDGLTCWSVSWWFIPFLYARPGEKEYTSVTRSKQPMR